MHRQILTIVLDEELYAIDSGNEYEKAEHQASVTNCYPVTYPSPYNEIGCGFGVLSKYVKIRVDGIASDLGIEVDICHQTSLMLMIYSHSEAIQVSFRKQLADSLRPLSTWILNKTEVLAN